MNNFRLSVWSIDHISSTDCWVELDGFQFNIELVNKPSMKLNYSQFFGLGTIFRNECQLMKCFN